MPRTRFLIGLGALALSLAALAAGQPAQAAPNLDPVKHVIVIYQENWSFDGLYGKFPGANGLANAGAAATQVDKSGKPYATLPPTLDLTKSPPEPNRRIPADLPNAPFDLAKYVPVDQQIGSPIHAFYQNQYQIDGGKNDKYVAWTNIGGLVMSYYDASGMPGGKLAKQYTLADNFFQAAYGGSFLNHFWLICACTPVWPNAPASKIVQLDANGVLTRDGQVTPDFYAVNTSYTVNTPHPANITDTAQLVPVQTMATIGDRLNELKITLGKLFGRLILNIQNTYHFRSDLDGHGEFKKSIRQKGIALKEHDVIYVIGKERFAGLSHMTNNACAAG